MRAMVAPCIRGGGAHLREAWAPRACASPTPSPRPWRRRQRPRWCGLGPSRAASPPGAAVDGRAPAPEPVQGVTPHGGAPMVRPPSTITVAPVTYSASAESRKAATLATSCAVAMRPLGMWLQIAATGGIPVWP